MKNSIKEKKILITGITGFVGSNLAKRLDALGATVYGISRSVENKRIKKLNILHYRSIHGLIEQLNVNICIHLAADSLVEKGQKKPYEVFTTNIQGTLNILESSRINKVEKIIVASTSHVYGKNKVPYFERYAARPSRPYETSKTCTDLIAQSYAETYKLPVLIPRFVNIYGPGDLNFGRLIPRTIKSVLLEKSPKMWGGDALRDYLYIDDAIDAYVALINLPKDKVKQRRIFNFGSGNVISVRDLIRKIALLSGKKISIEKIPDKRELEIPNQFVSWQRAARVLGWKPKTNLDEGLKKTFSWYKAQMRNVI